jgi:hypothetical protein
MAFPGAGQAVGPSRSGIAPPLEASALAIIPTTRHGSSRPIGSLVCCFHTRVSRFHAIADSYLMSPLGTRVAFYRSVEILAKLTDWYFMIAAPIILAVIALRGTRLSRL